VTSPADLPDYAPITQSALGPALNEQGYYVGRVELAWHGPNHTPDIEAFTTTTTFQIMQSYRLDRGHSGPVHP
jgi:hypothetical protein